MFCLLNNVLLPQAEGMLIITWDFGNHEGWEGLVQRQRVLMQVPKISHKRLHMQMPKISKHANWEKIKIFILLFGILPINDTEEDQAAKLAFSQE